VSHAALPDALIAGAFFSGLLAVIVAAAFSRSPAWATTARRGGRPPARPAGRPPGREQPHTGATEGYGRDLARMRHELPSADLLTPGEQMLADHRSTSDLDHAIDLFDQTIEAALDVFLRDQPLVRMRLTASVEHTGEIDRAELERLLTADDEELAAGVSR